MMNFAKEYFEKNGYKRMKCCICGCDFYDRTGNNPDPIIEDEDSVCCPACDQLFVIPKRMGLLEEFEDDDDFADEYCDFSDFEIFYHWYDHLVLRQNGDAKKVEKAILEGDYDTFMKYYNKYNSEEGTIYFPNHAAIYNGDECIGEIYITSPTGFRMITSTEYECG